MTDRELLELAAKASGELTSSWYGNDAYFEGVLSRWNPLEDDGDALRLAIKLEMDVSFGLRGAVIELSHGRKVQELDDNDQYTATRRAIVRAAAEIGRNMK